MNAQTCQREYIVLWCQMCHNSWRQLDQLHNWTWWASSSWSPEVRLILTLFSTISWLGIITQEDFRGSCDRFLCWSLCWLRSSKEFYLSLTLEVVFLLLSSGFVSQRLSSSLPTFPFLKWKRKEARQRVYFHHSSNGSLSLSCRQSKNVLDVAMN